MVEMTILTMSGVGVTSLPDEVLSLPKSEFYRWMEDNATPLRRLSKRKRTELQIVRKRALQRRYAHESRRRKKNRDEQTVVQLQETIDELKATVLALKIKIDERDRYIDELEKDIVGLIN